ncbi:hypothetical protein QCD79_34350, partial [Pseudomonas quasicaspiana]|nr:hypothetical protein [Pseudomonas quasicaspiana]
RDQLSPVSDPQLISQESWIVSPLRLSGHFGKFPELAGQAQWADDPRFLTNKLRVANRAELIPLIRQATVFK